MPKTLIHFPSELDTWLEENMQIPMKKVRFYGVEKLPFSWVPGFHPHIVGITLINRVFIRNKLLPFDFCSKRHIRLIIHELVHVQQVRRMTPVGFLISYLALMAKTGYFNHPYEKEAWKMEEYFYLKFLEDDPLNCNSKELIT